MYPNANWEQAPCGLETEPRRILIVRLGALGDIIHTVPSMQFLRTRWPESRIDWLVEPAWKPLLECCPGIDQIWEADTKRWRKSFSHLRTARALISHLRSQKYDLAVDFQGLVKSALLARLSGARSTAGFDNSNLREKVAGFFYQYRPDGMPEKIHQVEKNLHLLGARLHGEVSPKIDFEIPSPARLFIEKAFHELKIGQPPVLLNPGGGWVTKRWPPERFAVLAERIQGELGMDCVFSYGPGEESLIQAIQESSPAPVRSIAADLPQLAQLCSASRLFIGGDTGPMHLAVSLGTPVVAILGPAQVWKTGPFCPDDISVTHDTPCPHPYKRTCENHFCMDIPIERVFNGVRKRLAVN